MSEVEGVTMVELPRQAAMTMRFTAGPAEMAAKMGEVFGAIFEYASAHGELVGPPFTRYLAHDEAAERFDLEAGLPVAADVAGSGDILASELPAGRAATLWHIGPYDKLGEAHWALRHWVEQEGLTPVGGPWEVYVTDPGQEPDPQRWKTQLFQPIAG
jgi:AraC family transcriptional regulator